jgi:hypothetical protein
LHDRDRVAKHEQNSVSPSYLLRKDFKISLLFPLAWVFCGAVLSVPVVSVGRMETTRQLLPAGLADMPPGPGLAAVLTEIDPRRLSGLDCVELLRARHRQASHDQAQLMRAMVEVALCDIGPDDRLPRMARPDEFSADEIRGALAWTRRAADGQLTLAWDVIHRLPRVFAALDAGAIDVPKTRAFSDWTQGLTDGQAHEICDRLLPEAPRLTTGQLTERIKRMAIAIDPDWARRKYEAAVRDRKVVGYRNEDGSANLSGYNLPADRAAAACAHIDALAMKVKRSGDARPIDHIRADLYLGLLDGSYAAMSETDIIAHLLATADRRTESDDSAVKPRHRTYPPAETRETHPSDADHRAVRRIYQGGEGRDPVDARANTLPADLISNSASSGNDREGQVVEGPWPEEPSRPHRREGVEVRVEVTTLLGLDDHPAEIAGWGPVHADVARRLVRDQTAAEWRYAITDDDGHLLFEGITRHRPTGYPSRGAAPVRGGIVELQVELSTLRRLAARSARLGGWATVITDLIRQADRHQQQTDHASGAHSGEPVGHTDDPGTAPDHHDARQDDHHDARQDDQRDHATDARKRPDRGGRSPGTPLRRRTQIRDRTCIHPGCRAPAAGTDGDHTNDWAQGGATIEGNIGSLCRHDHRLKHQGGWAITQPEPGQFLVISRLGVHYHVRPPLIIQPLPHPIPRDPSPPGASARDIDPSENDHVPIWRVPAVAQRDPEPRPPPQPAEDPPF